jgi:hypothetical protein
MKKRTEEELKAKEVIQSPQSPCEISEEDGRRRRQYSWLCLLPLSLSIVLQSSFRAGLLHGRRMSVNAAFQPSDEIYVRTYTARWSPCNPRSVRYELRHLTMQVYSGASSSWGRDTMS